MNTTAFNNLPLKPELLSNLKSLGYNDMTPIQAQSLPVILNNQDVIAQGQTGSGKTAAFGLGLLNKLNVKRFRIQTLMLCPTRELADQVAVEIRRLARGIHNIKVLTLTGGVPLGPQIGSLEHGAHIIVGTPGRIEDLLYRRKLPLNDVDTLILDEADRMLDMGFEEAIDNIIDEIPRKRQTLLFSATYSDEIRDIALRILNNPASIKIENTHKNTDITQTLYRVPNDMARVTAVKLLLQQLKPESTVVFCNTRRETQEIADELFDYGFAAEAIHGDLEQRDRDQTLIRFANKSISILVATDVAARGLDIDALDAVINYQIAGELEVHVHRVGRTGRAGNKGIACTLYSDEDSYRVKRLEDYLSHTLPTSDLPSENLLTEQTYQPSMQTLLIDGGKKQKIRPGDILGALTGDSGLAGKEVGKIHITDLRAYVAVQKNVANRALKKLNSGKIKGRSFRVRKL